MSISADIVGSIDDLLMQILFCLPVKPLIRFKLVSKHWKSLITTHHVSFLRNQGSNPVAGLICLSHREILTFEYIPLDFKNPTKPPFRELSFLGETSSYWINQSCNGLLLCCTNGDSPSACCSFWNDYYVRIQYSICSFYVYNPTTKCCAKIPVPGKFVVGVNLAFDPVKSPHYKIVCIMCAMLDAFRFETHSIEHFQIEVYSSESGVWRACGEPLSSKARFTYGVYWNGSIHWMSSRLKELVYFNVNEEKAGKVALPATTRIGYFGVSGDHLHIVESCYGKQKSTIFNAYEMKRDYSEWLVKYRVDVGTMVTVAFPHMTNDNDVFCIYSLVQVEGSSFLVLEACGKVVRYNLDSNTWEEISDGIGDHVPRCLLPCAFEHIESLAGV